MWGEEILGCGVAKARTPGEGGEGGSHMGTARAQDLNIYFFYTTVFKYIVFYYFLLHFS